MDFKNPSYPPSMTDRSLTLNSIEDPTTSAAEKDPTSAKDAAEFSTLPAGTARLRKEREDHIGEDEVEAIADPVAAMEDAELEFPDGGLRAWLVVAGAFHITFATFGFTNSFGIFLSYYEANTLSEWSTSDISWIGSLQYCLVFLPALPIGRLLDLGYFKVPFFISAALYIVSIFLTAETTSFWQVLLCQGVLLGASAGVMFGPALAVVGHWWHRRRSAMYGVVACGSSIGGTCFPILIRNLIPKIGFKWTVRVCAFIVLYLVGFACLTLRPRLPPKDVKGGMFNLAAFKKPSFSLYVGACFLVILGLYTPLNYLAVNGEQNGLGGFSAYLISIANAASIIGRLLPGFWADSYGPVNILVPFSTLSGVMIFVWSSCTTKATLVIFAIIMGIATGSYVALFSPGVAQLGETADLGRRLGMLTSCIAFASLVGPPISGAILTKTGSFLSVAAFAGTVVFVGSGLFLCSKYALMGTVFRGKM